MSVTAQSGYPIIPRSEAELLPGHFWSIPLSDGRYACGVVVELDKMRSVAHFHGVLLDWIGSSLPTEAVVML